MKAATLPVQVGTSPVLLVVEDDADTSFLLCRALRNIAPGAEVRQATNGLAAQEELLRNPRPEILITDLDMPKLNGFQLIQWTRSVPYLSSVRIVVFSGSDDRVSRTRCEGFRIDDFIAKGSGMHQLKDRVGMLVLANRDGCLESKDGLVQTC